MNSLISLKYIHWFELDLKKGYRLNAAGVKTQSYRKKHDWLSGRKNTETKDSFSGTLDIDQIS